MEEFFFDSGRCFVRAAPYEAGKISVFFCTPHQYQDSMHGTIVIAR
jgi:hypothetical protein